MVPHFDVDGSGGVPPVPPRFSMSVMWGRYDAFVWPLKGPGKITEFYFWLTSPSDWE